MEDHRVLPAESQRKSLSPVYSRCRALGRTGSDLTWRQRSPSCARPGERGPARSCNSPLCSGPGRSPAQLVGQITTNIAFLAEIHGDILPSGPSKFFPTRFGTLKLQRGMGHIKHWSDLIFPLTFFLISNWSPRPNAKPLSVWAGDQISPSFLNELLLVVRIDRRTYLLT